MATAVFKSADERSAEKPERDAPRGHADAQAVVPALQLRAGPAAHQAALALQRSAGNRAVVRLLGASASAPAIQRYIGPTRVDYEQVTGNARRANPPSTANYATLFIADAGQANSNRTHTVASDHQTGTHAERLLVQWAGPNGVALNVPPNQIGTTRAIALHTELSPCGGCDALLTQSLHAQIPVTYTATYMPPNQYGQMLLIRRTLVEQAIRAAYQQRMPLLPLHLKRTLALVFRAALADVRGVNITAAAMLVAAANNALPQPPMGVPLGHASGAWRLDAHLAARQQHWIAQINAIVPPPVPAWQPPPPGPPGPQPVFAPPPPA